MSNSYKNIMVPFDGSTYSQKALKMSIEMASAFDSVVYLVNVVDITAVSPPGQIHSKETRKTLDQIKNSIKNSAESYLQNIQEDYKNSGVIMKGFVLEGDVTGELLGFMQDNDTDLIIMGSRGLSGISRIKTLGSVSRKVSELAKCPVVIVR